MKNSFTIILLFISAGLLHAQEYMHIHKSDGSQSQVPINIIDSITFSEGSSGTLTDYDGNTYETVTICDQTWMAENLKTTHYADGTEIPLVENNWANLNLNEKAYCFYGNDPENGDIYGVLYTWAAAMNGSSGSSSNPSEVQGVCPSGWHLPSDEEWKELEMCLGMSQAEADKSHRNVARGTDEGGKLKEAGLSHWRTPNEGATNSSGFTALPAGYMSDGGTALYQEDYAYFWTATEQSNENAWYRKLGYNHSGIFRSYEHQGRKTHGLSVRCVKD